MDWYQEPPQWRAEGNALSMTTGPQTDFWRAPDGSAIANNGHFWAQPVSGDFQAQVKFSGTYRDQYDQAGLMLWLDEANWLKCGIEFYEGAQHVSVVVTRRFSDWALAPLPPNPAALWLRLKRQGTDIQIHYSLNGTNYLLLRHAYFPASDHLLVGVMAASPTGNGFEVSFEDFNLS